MLKLFDLSLQLNGYPIRWAKQHVKSLIELPEAQFIQRLEQQKKGLLEFHLQHNSFYQKKVGDQQDLSWEQLPILKKSDYQVPLSERFSSGYSEKKCYLNKTSGSSGDPMVFAKDKVCHALIWANIMRKFAWHGIDFNRSYQARFYGMPMDENGHLLRSAREQMEAELTQLQNTLDGLSDDYANRAETMVREWLTQCRSKAKTRINAIDLADFFGSGEELSPQTVNVPALPSSEVNP